MNSPRIYTATYNGTEYTNTVKFFANLICTSETYVRSRIKIAFEDGNKRPMQYAIDDYVANVENKGKRSIPARTQPSDKIRRSNQALFAKNNKKIVNNFLYPYSVELMEKREHIKC